MYYDYSLEDVVELICVNTPRINVKTYDLNVVKCNLTMKANNKE